jgi:phosphoribosylformimino-5-aminoimidazole carboxamide ribotide isomerase
MILYPAVDIKGGRCVRLAQGRADQETVYTADPAEAAAEFQAAGAAWIHVVDLDGAFSGEPANLAAVAAIVALGMSVQLGGGLRTRAAVDRALGLGVSRVVIGTRAAESEAFVAELVRAHGERIAVGIDAKNGRVASRGWVDTSGPDARAFARSMGALGVSTVIYTDIDTDGMLAGPNYASLEGILAATDCRVIASGGVSCRGDVERLAGMKRHHPNLDGVIVGKALHERRVNLADLLALTA